MTLYEFLKPLQKIRKDCEETCIHLKNNTDVKYKGKIKNIPYELMDYTVYFWSYNFKDRLNLVLEEPEVVVWTIRY